MKYSVVYRQVLAPRIKTPFLSSRFPPPSPVAPQPPLVGRPMTSPPPPPPPPPPVSSSVDSSSSMLHPHKDHHSNRVLFTCAVGG